LQKDFPAWCERLGDDHVLTIDTLGSISETSLTRDVAIGLTQAGLPSTFVPGRNLVFFTFAAVLAYRRGIRTLVGGMCETDYSGYPDCRDDTLKALQVTLNLGFAARLVIQTPLMWIDKSQTWSMANALGGPRFVSLLLDETHTCYLGDRDTRHHWGYGCGTCPACELRRIGYEKFRGARVA
jgi:7-cyano-7-deazaguanine synthase